MSPRTKGGLRLGRGATSSAGPDRTTLGSGGLS